MSIQLGSAERPARVAIIGSGPSGFYAAGALLGQKTLTISVDMFDRLPTPFGLVRYGVAPDHQKIKSVVKLFERTAANPNFRFFGNVHFGRDISHADLHRHYDQIIYAVGAQSDRRLGIPGEDLRGSLSATEFVAWYNGHPDFVDLDVDLSRQGVVVVGVGNVAMDVARILAKSVDELRETDMADYALEKLTRSQVTDIYVLARRGPAQVKFTPPEFKEFGELAQVDVVVDAAQLALDADSAAAVEGDSILQRNLAHLHEFAQRPLTGKPKRVHFQFLRSPVEIIGEDDRVTQVRVEINRLEKNAAGYIASAGTGEFETIEAGLVLRSVGYRGVPMESVPYDERSGVIPNKAGRVIQPASGETVAGEYVVGWAKRGASGIIGTNKPDAGETVDCMIEDLSNAPAAAEPDPQAVVALLQQRNVRYVTMKEWQQLDSLETEAGEQQGRPRVKITSVDDMLNVLQK
ncbi:MAG: FAD-dependent oxidoreductase [Caldilineaceae bacterium]